MAGEIPQRPFGKSGVMVSALACGGHHFGDAPDEETAVRMIHDAVDGGITFFDNCWEYHRGKSEEWMGRGLKGPRDRVFLMTKVCTHDRDRELALRMLKESLRRLQIDHLDLWQVHGVSFENDPDLFIRPGAAEALAKAKKEGKVRFVGFTGHKDPAMHLKMLIRRGADAAESARCPISQLRKAGSARAEPARNRGARHEAAARPRRCIKKGAITPEQALRYAMSLPVTTTIMGIDKLEVLRQNLRIAQNFQRMSVSEMQQVRDSVKEYAADERFESYKLSLEYDNPEARIAQEFPLDMQQAEVKEMLGATQNDGNPYPTISE